MFFLRMSGLHAMPITNITRNACHYAVKLRVSAKDITLSHLTAIIQHICIFVCRVSAVCVSQITHRSWRNHQHSCMQLSSVLKIKMVQQSSRPYFHLFHYYIVWESNNAGEARGQSWNEILKSRCIPGGFCRLDEWYKTKIFCFAFFAAAMTAMVAAANIVWFPLVHTLVAWWWLIVQNTYFVYFSISNSISGTTDQDDIFGL